MKHVVCFSGGKDSTALVLWAKENLAEFITVFCDTGWEHKITYAGTSATMFSCTVPMLDAARRQPSLLTPKHSGA